MDPDKRISRVSPGWRSIIKLLVSLGMLGWILSYIPVTDIWGVYRTADAVVLKVAFGVFLVFHIVVARRMRLLTRHQGLTLTTFDHFRISATTAFHKLWLPGGVGGGVIRWYKMSKQDRRPAAVLNVMVFDRIISALVFSLLGLFFLALDFPFGEHPLAWAACALLGASLLVHIFLYVLAFNGTWARRVQVHIAPRLPSRWGQTLNRLAESSDRFNALSARLRWAIWGWAATGRIINLCMYYLFARALFLPLDFATVAWIRSVVYMVVLLPITFSGLGLREGAMLACLTPYGIEPASIVAFSMLVFIAVLLHAFMGAVFEIADALTHTRSRKKEERAT